MKKVFLLAFVLLLISSSAIAETLNSIQFRGLDWYDTSYNVDLKIKEISGVKIPWFMSVSENTRIDGWDKEWKYFYTDDSVESGGVIRRYENVPVAGYEANLDLSFMYPIVDGLVDRYTHNAQLYMAIYTIDKLEDLKGVYESLVQKLSDSYGSYTDYSHASADVQGCLWEAKDGSLIWIALRYNSVSKKYEEVNITYYAPDGSKRLKELDTQIHNELVNTEKAEREKNSSNYDGL